MGEASSKSLKPLSKAGNGLERILSYGIPPFHKTAMRAPCSSIIYHDPPVQQCISNLCIGPCEEIRMLTV